MKKAPNFLLSILKMKCPVCREGDMFTTKSVFPLNKLQSMPDSCSVCGQKMELEPGFYYGTGYVSYGLSIALSVFNLIWFGLIFGISFKYNSIFQYLAVNIAILLLLLPWIVRYSRVLYLNIFVRYKGDKGKKKEEE